MPHVIFKNAHDSEFDEITGSRRGISEIRHLLHSGKVFVATETYTILDKDEVHDIILITGPETDTSPHVLDLLVLSRFFGTKLSVYINPTYGPLPQPEVSFNLNFQSTRTGKSKVWTGATIIDPGSLITTIPMPNGYAAGSTPELLSVLPPATTFLFRLDVAEKSQDVRFVFKWYEQQHDQDLIRTN